MAAVRRRGALAAVLLSAALAAGSASEVAGAPPPPPPGTGGKKIDLSSLSVIDAWCAPMGGGCEDDVPYNLLDEQTLVGDPRSGDNKTPQTYWSPGYVKWYYPEITAVIDLGATYKLTSIWGWHQYGGADIVLSFAADDLLSPVATAHVCTAPGPTCPSPVRGWEKSWRPLANVSVTARYLSVQLLTETNIYELVIYGDLVSPAPPPPPPPPPHKAPLMRSFLGVNGFVDDPVSRLSCVGAVREYQDWSWTEGEGDPGFPHAANKFSPTYSGFDIDGFYESVANASLDLHQCLQARPWFLSHGNATETSWKPVPDSQIYNVTAIVDPATYAAIAAHGFQVAARYGSVAVPHSMLQLAPGQKVVSGMGVLKHIEFLNEPDGWWAGREHFMKPFEIAAMLSAAYDGHESTLGAGVGVKAADPAVQVVMPGVTGTARRNLDVVRMIRLWAQSSRKDGRFPADVLNFHGYSTLGSNQGGGSQPVDQTPEQAGMMEGLSELAAWRDRYEPTLAVWQTEFGWDTNQASPDRALAYAQYTAEEVQAAWLVRGFMLGCAAGLDRMHIFMLRNVNDRGGTKFETCGLTSSKDTQWQPKLSWYYVAAVTSVLGHLRFKQLSVVNSTHLYAAEFDADPTDGAPPDGAATRAFVVWLGTMKGSSVGYKLDLGGGAGGQPVTLVTLAANSTVGNQSALTPSGGAVQLAVTEMPVVVLVGAKPQPATGPVPPIDAPAFWTCKTSDGQEALGPGLYCGDGGNTTSPPGPGYRVCPSGATRSCPDGATCQQAGDGVIKCVPDASSPCYNKQAGLYCSAAPKPGPAWPDGYTECPSTATFFCPTSAPRCAQDGIRVTCA